MGYYCDECYHPVQEHDATGCNVAAPYDQSDPSMGYVRCMCPMRAEVVLRAR